MNCPIVAAHEQIAMEDAAGVEMEAIAGESGEAAKLRGAKMSGWMPPLNSTDAAIIPNRFFDNARADDLLRSDSYLQAAGDLTQNSVVGSQYRLNCKPLYQVLGLDEVWAMEFAEEFEQKFMLLAESHHAFLDFEGTKTFSESIRLGVLLDMMRGETLLVSRWDRETRRPLRTQFQEINVDRLSNPPGRISSPQLRGGVERNSQGRVLGYHVRSAHPTDFDATDRLWRWDYIPKMTRWGRMVAQHLYEHVGPEQTRGVQRIVSALKETKMRRDWSDTVLENMVMNASIAASITSEMPTSEVYKALGAEDVPAAMRGINSAMMAELAKYQAGAKSLTFNGARIPHLYPGTKLELMPAGNGNTLGGDFEQSMLRYTAAALDVSFEELSRDLRNSNMAGIKAAMGQTQQSMKARKRRSADRRAKFIAVNVWEEMVVRGMLETMKGPNMPSIFDPMMREAYTNCDFIGAGRPMIDELKESQAAVLRVKHGLSTREIECARLGYDWRTIAAQAAREYEDLPDHLKNVEDNMINAASGGVRESEDA